MYIRYVNISKLKLLSPVPYKDHLKKTTRMSIRIAVFKGLTKNNRGPYNDVKRSYRFYRDGRLQYNLYAFFCCIFFVVIYSIDRWSISNTTLEYTDTIKMQAVDNMAQGTPPFVLPLTDETNQLFRNAGSDLTKSNIYFFFILILNHPIS